MLDRVPYSSRRHLCAALTGIVVCLVLTLNSLPAAQALPSDPGRIVGTGGAPDQQWAAPGGVNAAAATKDKITFGPSTLSAGKQAGKIARRAMSKSGKTLNYAKAKAEGGRTKWRRQFAAGFYWQGGKITHISDAEFAEVREFLPPSPAVAPQREPNCTGVNKTIVVRHDS